MNRVFLALAGLLLITFAAIAQTTNGSTKAEIQGRQLVQQILVERPVTNFTQNGILTVRNPGGTTNIPITFQTIVEGENWKVAYFANMTPTNKGPFVNLRIVRAEGQPNEYFIYQGTRHDLEANFHTTLMTKLTEAGIWAPFTDSDFWIADLGLEFFHWPGQKILKHEDKRTRACAVLESTNPNPSPGAYSRVMSWIDNETLGIVHAEAYDADGKLLKVFDPKSFKKVNGQWELQDMEIRNVQTKSRTSIKFDLNNK
jgi:Outer membrane lipoprotein-sorting protein